MSGHVAFLDAMLQQQQAQGPVSGWYQKKPVMVRAYRAQECEYIDTLEGRMRADAGDWVVTGVEGERYPVKNDIFLSTYRRVG